MESMGSADHHYTMLRTLRNKDDPKDLLKYVLINADSLEQTGVAGATLRMLAAHLLDLDEPALESEYN